MIKKMLISNKKNFKINYYQSIKLNMNYKKFLNSYKMMKFNKQEKT